MHRIWRARTAVAIILKNKIIKYPRVSDMPQLNSKFFPGPCRQSDWYLSPAIHHKIYHSARCARTTANRKLNSFVMVWPDNSMMQLHVTPAFAKCYWSWFDKASVCIFNNLDFWIKSVCHNNWFRCSSKARMMQDSQHRNRCEPNRSPGYRFDKITLCSRLKGYEIVQIWGFER